MTAIMETADFVAQLQSPTGIENLLELDPPLVMINLDEADPDSIERAVKALTALPIVVVGHGSTVISSAALADVTIDREDMGLEHIENSVRRNPRASVALALLLRSAEKRSIPEGLVAESAVYSMLQGGPEFRSWLSSRPSSEPVTPHGPVVRVDRQRDVLRITLCRPQKHNALNTEMRDALYEALSIGAWDPTTRVVLEGEGPSFCAGGDLTEFGSFPDPAQAHAIRLRRSIGRMLSTMSDRVTSVLHGACLGAGIELPAFGDRVIAASDARLGLPEIGLGLVPGAGGTVSVTRRIGRHRTAFLALSGQTIHSQCALEWGLIDEIYDDEPPTIG